MERLVIISGFGRSGTTTLSNLFGASESVKAYHEFFKSKEFEVLSAYLGDNYLDLFYEQLRSSLIESHRFDETIMDINGAYRRSLNKMNEVLQPQTSILIYREGKDLVRSIYNRRNDNNIHVLPNDRVSLSSWFKGDRFEQICINYRDDMQKMLSSGLPFFSLTRIVSDYSYYQGVCDVLNIKPINFLHWKKECGKRRNSHSLFGRLKRYMKGKTSHNLNGSEQWTKNQKDVYNYYCAELDDKARKRCI